MENIVITPKDKKQLSVLKLILQEMKVNFFVQKKKDDTLYTKEEFYAKIEQSAKEAAEGKVTRLTPALRKKLFKSVL